MTIKLLTAKLHPYVRQLIKGLKTKLDTPGPALEQKYKRFAPREVEVAFQPGVHAKVNVAAFSFVAVNGSEVSREEHKTWMGSDGEPNYTELVSYEGPVVAVYGHGKRRRVVVYVPTGLADEYPEVTEYHSQYHETPHWLAVQHFRDGIDPVFLNVLIDGVLEGRPFPIYTPPIAIYPKEESP